MIRNCTFRTVTGSKYIVHDETITRLSEQPIQNSPAEVLDHVSINFLEVEVGARGLFRVVGTNGFYRTSPVTEVES